MRAVWKGDLTISLVNVPVAAYKAVDSAKGTKKRWLHKGCGNPVNLEKICAKCNKVLPSMDEVVDGVPQDDGTFVIITDEDLDAIKVATTKSIIIEKVIPSSGIDDIYVESTYFLGPSKPTPAFALIREALKSRNTVMIGRLSIYGREHLVAVRPLDQILALELLNTASQVRPASGVPHFSTISESVDPTQLALANQILSSYDGIFDPTTNEDNYVKAFQTMVAAKKDGIVAPPTFAVVKPTLDLMGALAASLAAIKKPVVVVAVTKKPATTKKVKVG